ncbi:DNA adenine methylase [Salmonella enterica]|jgi:DNA adenine methylase|uniref:site-specific DNA-methyltransferase (adenine-specific) n=2 Tax=Enterobacter cloacae complex TaxID=354276 RepID=A0AB36FEV3_ENTAS|nr:MULTISPECIES: DNA adenine methylase [Enterobacteriaceae]EAA2619939.1 DNA adenine methylase [Salmonella enterica]ECI4629465.1 DNA adenine methylase [Salmonella enterica subsp. enterica serovar Hartford]EDV0555854.1 DNA adenine methylase [Salmonella enterica subsp. enterica serovar Cotham]EEI9212428.1 DNA adenine methylase [Salmonella enterica subsp. enterica serovar Carrau]EIJ6702873.1 DNA adenine methylase [Serratia marcescens]MCU3009506.1 DNA adenine methylase [Enterobacter hormaechei sub
MKEQSLPIVPWIGGKRRLAKHILPLFPAHTCYVEPFCGAAALYFLKTPSKIEVINDINGELVNLYRVVKHHLEEFVRQFKWALVSRQIYKWLQDTPEETLTDIQRAARFYYLQKQAFGGKVADHTFGTSTTSAPRFNLLRIEEELSMAHLRLSRTLIEHLDWHQCIERYDRPHTLFYCDPPYWGTEGYGVEFGLENYDHMAELARSTKGKMIISVNDIPEMRQAFNGLNIQTVDISYNLKVTGKATPRKELVICNF